MAKVEASYWTVPKLWVGKRGQRLLSHPSVRAALLAAAEREVARIRAGIAPHSRTGRLLSSVGAPKAGRGKNKYRYTIVVGRDVAYLLAFELGRKTNGPYKGFHVINKFYVE